MGTVEDAEVTDIRILSRTAAYQFLVLAKNGKTYPTILITDYEGDTYYVNQITECTPNLLHLKFDDVTNGPNAPDQKNIQRAIDFGRECDNIVVACMAGISRSSAIALLIAVERLGTSEAFKCLNHYIHYPNVTVVKIGSQILNKPEIMTEYNKYLKEFFKRSYF